MAENKQKIIAEVYFDKAGFGSRKTTLEDRRKKDKNITKEDVEQFFRKNVEVKKKPRGMNSFVAPYNNHTYQIDLFFISKDDLEAKQKFRAGLVAIDVLSKYAVVVPIKGKETTDVIAGTMEALQKMGAKPKIIYTDDEKAIASSEFKQYVDDEGIELYRTRGHPAFSERFIRTFKDKLFKRIEADENRGKQHIQWIDYILEIMLTYNNKDVHSATGQTPNEARKKKNEFKSVMSVSMKAKKERIYPELHIGDKVKIVRKKTITEKERTSHFLKGEYVVEEISEKLNQKYYKLTDYPRPLLMHELLKV
jgi:transposase InsO family protein